MTNAAQVFNHQASGYDLARRRLIPPYDAFYATAVDALALAGEPRRILDLGAGTGLLAAAVRDALPEAHLTLVDGASVMLERARESLGDDRVDYLLADLRDPLPAGDWDAVVSALAVHHLEDHQKRSLFTHVFAALRPGGLFVNAEQVSGPTPFFTELYERWHKRCARAGGSDDAEWQGALERMSYDRCSSVEDQLRWLRDAGFLDADCLFKDHRFAVMVARRAG